MPDDFQTQTGLSEWLWRLDCIQNELAQVAPDLCIAFSLRLADELCHSANRTSMQSKAESFPLGRFISGDYVAIEVYEELCGILWLDFRRETRPGNVCWEDLSLHQSLPSVLYQCDYERLVPCSEWGTIFYLTKKDSPSQPGKRKRAKLPVISGVSLVSPDDVEGMRRNVRMYELFGAIMEACHNAPDAVLRRVGDLSELDSWPSALFLLALERVHPCLTASWHELEHGRVKWDKDGQSASLVPRGPKDPIKFQDVYDYIVQISPENLVAATGYAFDALRQIAKSNNMPPSEPSPNNLDKDGKAANASNRPAARKGGMKPNPKVQHRNKRIVTDAAKGMDVGDLCDKYHISAPLVRKILSNARKKAEKNRQS